jgi:predicted hydrocarbon binding protein
VKKLSKFEEELRRILTKETIRKEIGDQINIKSPRTLALSIQWISVGYASALYFAGKKLGTSIIAKEIGGKTIEEVLAEIGKLINTIGIGKFNVVEVGNGKCRVRIDQSATAYGMKPVGKPVCFFESGLIAGVLEGKIGKKVTVNEVLCGGLGDTTEEFLVRIS